MEGHCKFEREEDNTQVSNTSVAGDCFKMRGKLNGSTFETPDGQKYYRVKTDALKSKLYFRCKNYSKGCRVVLHTEYVDCDDDDLKVISTSGKHNHRFNQNSSGCGVRRGRKRNYAGLVYDDEDSELDEEEGGEGEDGYEGEGDKSDDGEDREETEDEEEKDGTDEGEEITEDEEDEDEKDTPDYDEEEEEEEEGEGGEEG